jgi:hypothetical protein
MVAILGLSVLVASATMPCAAWAKGGDQGNGNGNGNGGGHGDNNGNGNGGGNGNGNGSGGGGHGDHNGPGNGNGGGASSNGGGAAAASGGGAHGSGSPASSANSGTQANPVSTSGGSIGTSGTSYEGLASSPMLNRAVVALNATLAVPRPPAQAGLNSHIRQMAVYDRAMVRALAMPDRTPAQRVARNRAIAGARIQLAAATNRRLNPAAVSRIDSLLGLPASDPALGVQ